MRKGVNKNDLDNYSYRNSIKTTECNVESI